MAVVGHVLPSVFGIDVDLLVKTDSPSGTPHSLAMRAWVTPCPLRLGHIFNQDAIIHGQISCILFDLESCLHFCDVALRRYPIPQILDVFSLQQSDC